MLGLVTYPRNYVRMLQEEYRRYCASQKKGKQGTKEEQPECIIFYDQKDL